MRFRRVHHAIRTATSLTGSRPAYAAGVRAAIATIVPLAAAALIGNADAGTWMSLGGFNGALSDRGGAYVPRARTMLAVMLGGVVAATCGTLAAGHTVMALVITFIVAFLASSLRVFGNDGFSVSSASLTVYVVALAIHPALPADLVIRGGFLVAGSLWAMVVALLLWPLQPYRPARAAVSDVFDSLSVYIRDVSLDASQKQTAEWPVQHSLASISMVRNALEAARMVLVQLRRGRPGIVERGERLLVMNDSADQIFGHVAALGDLLSSLRQDETRRAAYDACIRELDRAADTVQSIARAVLLEKSAAVIPVSWNGGAVRAAAIDSDDQVEHAAIVLDRAAQFASSASLSVQVLNSGRDHDASASNVERQPSAEVSANDQPMIETWRSVFARHSLIGQFALRVAIVTTIAVGLNEAFAIKRGYWLTLTALVILQPYTGVTLMRAGQRVIGTVLGALIAAGLGALLHDERGILVIATIFVACCVALLPVNYAAFSVFLTPTFVLLAEASAGDWTLASTRVLNTLTGGALALAGSFLLWPSPEKRRFPTFVAAAIRANAAYLGTVVRLFNDRGQVAGEQMRNARRAVGLATINAEESLQRALVEAHGDERKLSPSLTLLAYTRRFTATAAALALARHSQDSTAQRELAPFQARIDEVLDDLASSLERSRPPSALNRFDVPSNSLIASPVLLARVERLMRQVRTLHDAVMRLNGAAIGG